jgi:hypothetical protein
MVRPSRAGPIAASRTLRVSLFPKVRQRKQAALRENASCQLCNARCILDDISAVTTLCSSTAAAVEVTNSLTLSIAVLIATRELATSPEIPLSNSISLEILCVACLAWFARFFTSPATTAKPLPASPARAEGPERPLGSPDHGRDGETVSQFPQSNSQIAVTLLADTAEPLLAPA